MENAITTYDNHDMNVNAIQQLSFDQALDLPVFYSKIKEASLETIKEKTISALGIREIVESSQIEVAIKECRDCPDFIFELSDKGKKLLKDGKAEVVLHKNSNKYLPQIRDEESGKIIELFKGEKVNLTTKLVKVSNIIVNCANMISAADIAKKLCDVDQKMDQLLSLRKTDLISRLESNYNMAREISSCPYGNLDLISLRDLHKENMFLRSAWRRELEYNLSMMETPEKWNYLKKITTSQKALDNKLCEEISQLEGEIHLIEFSVIYDIVLTEMSGLGNVFREKTLFDEIQNLNSLKCHLQEKINLIDSNHIINKHNIKPILASLEQMGEKFQEFVPSQIAYADN